jgi:DNA polymerase III delta prime subunit
MSQSTVSPLQPTFIIKYKPYFIDDFCLDPKLLASIKTLFEIDSLNLLFIGNSNSGKTTLLYAIIREYYKLGRNSPFPENNILFINNLKEQGIQYFRNEMKTFCQSHSSIYGKKKLVIIDDIDSINEQSQQVFRNYIDKYKHNIHFISVCSNIQKVIESIQSRVHILQIHPPSDMHIRETMQKIVDFENIDISDEAKEYLLKVSNHSMRILINYLEKMFIYKQHIELEICKQLCSNISFQQFDLYFEKLTRGDLVGAIDILYRIHDYGYSVIDILDYFFAFLKMTNGINDEIKYQILPYLCKYITIFHNVHEDRIELALFTNNLHKLICCSAK